MRRHIIPRFIITTLLVLPFAACTTLNVKTDLDELPTREDSVAWLNGYFLEKNKRFWVSNEILREPRKGAPPYRCIVEYTVSNTMNIQCSGTISGRAGGNRGSSGSFKELVRWSVSGESEAVKVIEHLMVLGVKYNKIERLVAQECFRSNKGCPPGYP